MTNEEKSEKIRLLIDYLYEIEKEKSRNKYGVLETTPHNNAIDKEKKEVQELILEVLLNENKLIITEMPDRAKKRLSEEIDLFVAERLQYEKYPNTIVDINANWRNISSIVTQKKDDGENLELRKRRLCIYTDKILVLENYKDASRCRTETTYGCFEHGDNGSIENTSSRVNHGLMVDKKGNGYVMTAVFDLNRIEYKENGETKWDQTVTCHKVIENLDTGKLGEMAENLNGVVGLIYTDDMLEKYVNEHMIGDYQF